MRPLHHFFLVLLFLCLFFKSAFAVEAIACNDDASSCYVETASTTARAEADASAKCTTAGAQCIWFHVINSECVSVSISNTAVYFGEGSTSTAAAQDSTAKCRTASVSFCSDIKFTRCDPPADRPSIPEFYSKPSAPIVHSASTKNINSALSPQILAHYLPSNLLDIAAIRTGISFGIGIIIALLIFAKRAAIFNLIIHGNLPATLPVYAEDVQVLFKRSQRVNWYGRVIFGITARLSMTEKQLALVRKYWLGRVIAFDSLRRQRQNELARLHLQLAMTASADAHDKKKFWSRRWATVRTFFKRLFWIITASIGFILSFFFIRVTIAKLARGKLIESKDLALLMQSKEAVEDSTTYLREYLVLAETFHGEEELFEPK